MTPNNCVITRSSAPEPLLALCIHFFLSLGSEELAAAQFLQNRELEATCNYELQVQVLPSSDQEEQMKPINNNLLCPHPLKRFVNSFKPSHSSDRG